MIIITNDSERLPKSLRDEVTRVANRDRTSVNQFIAIAVAEKIDELEHPHNDQAKVTSY